MSFFAFYVFSVFTAIVCVYWCAFVAS